jgi:hypothetical protein
MESMKHIQEGRCEEGLLVSMWSERLCQYGLELRESILLSDHLGHDLFLPYFNFLTLELSSYLRISVQHSSQLQHDDS